MVVKKTYRGNGNTGTPVHSGVERPHANPRGADKAKDGSPDSEAKTKKG